MAYMIEFAGTPNAGKTSVIDMVDRQLRRSGLTVMSQPEASNLIRNGRELKHIYDIRTLIPNLAVLIDNINHSEYDVILFDRCVYDNYMWLHYREIQNGNVAFTQPAKEFVKLFFQHIHLCILLSCKPEEASRRDRTHSIAKADGISNNIVFLQGLCDAYGSGYDILNSNKILRIDTTGLMPIDTARMVYPSIEQLVE